MFVSVPDFEFVQRNAVLLLFPRHFLFHLLDFLLCLQGELTLDLGIHLKLFPENKKKVKLLFRRALCKLAVQLR